MIKAAAATTGDSTISRKNIFRLFGAPRSLEAEASTIAFGSQLLPMMGWTPPNGIEVGRGAGGIDPPWERARYNLGSGQNWLILFPRNLSAHHLASVIQQKHVDQRPVGELYVEGVHAASVDFAESDRLKFTEVCQHFLDPGKLLTRRCCESRRHFVVVRITAGQGDHRFPRNCLRPRMGRGARSFDHCSAPRA